MPLLKNNFIWCLKKDTLYHDGALVYAQCKRAMIEMTDMMATKSNATIVSVHPGWCETPGLQPLYEQQPSYKNFKFRESLEGAYG